MNRLAPLGLSFNKMVASVFAILVLWKGAQVRNTKLCILVLVRYGMRVRAHAHEAISVKMSSGAATKDLVLAAVNTKASRIRRFTKEAKTRKVVREALWSREASVTSHVNQGANREEI